MQRLAVATAVALVVISALAVTHPSHSAPPAPKASSIATPGLEVATFAGGCFWSMEYAFDKVEGVHQTVSGFMGGKTPNPTYEEVSHGNTGHAESVQVTYDPRSELPAARRLLLAPHRPARRRRAVLRPRRRIPAGDLRPHAGAKADGGRQRSQARRQPSLLDADRGRHRRRRPVHGGGGLHQNFHNTNEAHYKRYRAGCGLTGG